MSDSILFQMRKVPEFISGAFLFDFLAVLNLVPTTAISRILTK